MKSWLIKFNISNALNDRRPLPPAIAQAIARSEELRRFAEGSRTLDVALRGEPPVTRIPAPLHTSIMRAVRGTGNAPAAEPPWGWPHWSAVAVPVLLIFFGIVLAMEFFPHQDRKLQPEHSHGLAAAGAALELGGNLVREAPAIAMSPLSDEMERLDRDLVSTKEFLLASLP